VFGSFPLLSRLSGCVRSGLGVGLSCVWFVPAAFRSKPLMSRPSGSKREMSPYNKRLVVELKSKMRIK
jgi:hypothetical protein